MACGRYQPMPSTKSDDATDPALFTQRKKVKNVVGALLGFACVGMVLSLVIFIMNVAAIGRGTKVYSVMTDSYYPYGNYGGYYASSSFSPSGYNNYPYNTYSNQQVYGRQLVSFYPGVWFGVTEFFMCLAVVIFGVKSIRRSNLGQNATATTGVRVSGILLSVGFGVATLVAIAACACATVTYIYLLEIGGYSSCTESANPALPGCLCYWSDVYVMDVPSCDYAQNTLSNIYATVAALSGFMTIINIVIASLFCGVLCCCVPTYFPVEGTAMRIMPPNLETATIATNVAAIPSTNDTPDSTPPAYM